MLIPALARGQQPGRCRPETIEKNQCIWRAGRWHARGKMYSGGTALCRSDMPTARTKASRVGDEHDWQQVV